ncbi:MAG: hypothetical protein RLZZ458_1037 [Planctomycetota bacterium]
MSNYRKSLFEGLEGAKRPRDRRAVRNQVAEYVAGFANAEGGILILGIEDHHTVTGHNLPDEDYLLKRKLADRRGDRIQLRRAAELLFARLGPDHPNAGVRVFRVIALICRHRDCCDQGVTGFASARELPSVSTSIRPLVSTTTSRSRISRTAPLIAAVVNASPGPVRVTRLLSSSVIHTSG